MVSLEVGSEKEVMYGTAVNRLSRPLRWSKKDNSTWIAVDGNENAAYRVTKVRSDHYIAEYTTPSLRLCSGPKAPFLNLGKYWTLDDAKSISSLHESCETIPVFQPGELVGWVDREGRVSLRDDTALSSSFFVKTFTYLYMFLSKLRRYLEKWIPLKK